jgi:hypothetical protein
MGVSFGFVLVLAVAGCTGDPPAPSDSAWAHLEQPIINGDVETGWPGVGALTLVIPGWGYQGSFCTGTLISPNWVLTAAHCLTEHEGRRITPDNVRFYVGNNANSERWGQPPREGALYRAQSFHIHPAYDAVGIRNDIGLVRLADPAVGVETYPVNLAPLSNQDIGQAIFYVGFGVTDDRRQTGSGVKRSTLISLHSVYPSYYASVYAGTGVCFGDSGGPGLLVKDGEWRVVGVNSSGAGTEAAPCRGYYQHMRADYYTEWIAEITGTGMDCRAQPGTCLCDQACAPSGLCENDRCRVLDCGGLLSCLDACARNDSDCQGDCYKFSTADAQVRYDALGRCSSIACMNLTGTALDVCVEERCRNETASCLGGESGEESCETLLACSRRCAGDDPHCQAECRAEGTSDAQSALRQLFMCWLQACGPLGATQEYWHCTYELCASEYDICLEPAWCDLVGGDCPAGTGCHVGVTGATDCFPSGDVGLGEVCDPAWANVLPCADGLVCLPRPEGAGVCIPRCREPADCPGEGRCVVPYFDDEDDFGICSIVLPSPGDDDCPGGVDCEPEAPVDPPDDGCPEGEPDCNDAPDDGSSPSGGGCAGSAQTGQSAPFLLLLVPVVFLASRRRRCARRIPS